MIRSITCALLFSLAVPFAAAAAPDMAFPGRNWDEATPESQGVDAGKLQAAVTYLQQHSGRDGVKELVIVRNGRMIWKGSEIDNVHYIASMTKSFTSTVLGLLIDDGKCSLDTLARDYVPAMAAAYPAITLRHFATMTSGYRAVGDEPIGNYKHGPSKTPLLPSETPLFAPGTKFSYWDSAMNQFGHVLTRIADESIGELFQRRIADPIGMASNNRMFVVPAWNLVVVRLAQEWRPTETIHDAVWSEFLQMLGQAVMTGVAKDTTRVQPRLTAVSLEKTRFLIEAIQQLLGDERLPRK